MKRFLGAVFFTAVLVVLAACGMLNTGAATAATATPTSSTSRSARSGPVTVNQTVANAQTVDGDKAGETASSKGASSAVASSTTATPAAQADSTPATGDFPLMYLAGVIGLILICSAGLLMLRRI